MHSSSARFRYHGTGGSLFGLMVVNAVLTMLTLGIYSFWARNKVREYHYANTEADGDRFAYHGTGGELLKGALRVFAVFLVLGIVLAVGVAGLGGENISPGAEAVVTFAIYGVVLLLAPAAINLTRRYRLSRSSWRGVRFAFHGATADYVKLSLRGGLLSLVTFGLYTPFFQSENRAFLVNHARFGSEPFAYDGEGRELFGEFLKALLLTIPTLGLSWIWYSAFKQRYFWAHTRMRGAQFVCTVTGRDLLALHATNLLLVLCTLGIATPWAITRMHAFACDHLQLMGTVDWASIQQHGQTANATGEGLADTLDMDVDLGF